MKKRIDVLKELLKGPEISDELDKMLRKAMLFLGPIDVWLNSVDYIFMGYNAGDVQAQQNMQNYLVQNQLAINWQQVMA